MTDFEKEAGLQEREVRYFSGLTRNYIENGQRYDLAEEDELAAAVIDVLNETVYDHSKDEHQLTVYVQDMGENYPGVSIFGYKKKVFLGNAGGKEIFTLFEINDIDTGLPIGLVVEDEREGSLSYWKFDKETESYLEVDGEDVESISIRHTLSQAVSAPELDQQNLAAA